MEVINDEETKVTSAEETLEETTLKLESELRKSEEPREAHLKEVDGDVRN